MVDKYVLISPKVVVPMAAVEVVSAVVNIVADPDALNVVKKATLAESVHKTEAMATEVVVVAVEVAEVAVTVAEVAVMGAKEVAVTVEVAEVVTADAVADVVATPESICLRKIKRRKKVLSKPMQVLENL